ncbi:uncharacterized protein METZ01_LOCUS421274 [marine metagenome]|uniref:EamA domain-containing protein n=1 Tax=marine metagenome TaxID=408172 RepID=A0A382XC68_9ZZZZ
MFVYLSLFSSFFSGIFLVLTDFIDNQTLIEIYGNRVLFNLFIPFMIGLVCLWGTRRQKVSIYYLPFNLIFGSLLLFGYQILMFNLLGNYAFFYLISAIFLLSSAITSFILVSIKRKNS